MWGGVAAGLHRLCAKPSPAAMPWSERRQRPLLFPLIWRRCDGLLKIIHPALELTIHDAH